MFKYIPGNHQFSISLEGLFKSHLVTKDGLGCTPEVQDGTVTIEFYGKPERLGVDWLARMAHYEVYIPNELNVNLFNITFHGNSMVFKFPIEFGEGFRLIPGFVRYGVTKDGKYIYDLYSGLLVNIVAPVKANGDKYYARASIYDPAKNVTRTISVHRLVALAWVHNPDRDINIFVNHKDGDKWNPHADNLEWVTPKENCVHAFQTNLRDDNVPCKVRNAQTGDITEFVSLSQCCSFIGIAQTSVRKNFKHVRQNKLLGGKYELRVDGDDRPWVHESGIKKPGRYIVHISSLAGEREEFNDTRDIIKRYKLWNMGGTGIKNILERMARDYPYLTVEVIDQYDTRPIQAIDVSSREVKETKTVIEMSKITGLDHRVILRFLKKKQMVSIEGYAYRYKTEEPWPDTIEQTTSHATCIVATHSKSGDSIELKSLREAAARFNVDRSLIKVRLQKGTDYLGWIFKEVA